MDIRGHSVLWSPRKASTKKNFCVPSHPPVPFSTKPRHKITIVALIKTTQNCIISLSSKICRKFIKLGSCWYNGLRGETTGAMCQIFCFLLAKKLLISMTAAHEQYRDAGALLKSVSVGWVGCNRSWTFLILAGKKKMTESTEVTNLSRFALCYVLDTTHIWVC